MIYFLKRAHTQESQFGHLHFKSNLQNRMGSIFQSFNSQHPAHLDLGAQLYNLKDKGPLCFTTTKATMACVLFLK